ncbi:MAG: cytochrome b N-terminal domain-containing protein [Pirellulales bacterium]|nr:cytochrome b N-terminal domain-containing protein [Pirellulales bacterium]
MISFGRAVGEWLDDRAGIRKIMQAMLYEPIPGGARWRYVWGSTLVVAFMTQVITGVFLWMAYSPSTQTAWESVFYIQHEMTGGWLLRGIHHFMASAMVVLLALHFMQVVWDGAYRAPRELNFVLGLVLMLIVLGLALTGYLLPWDQKGYWATRVGTELASQAPLAGPDIKKLTVGGSEYGHLTLTRFFALHAGVLPGLLVMFLTLHLALFRRHGIHARVPHRGEEQTFWPDQVLKDAVAALAVLAVVLGLTIYFGGAELTAPADPANPYNAARPEWYFLFLFQFLKWFPGQLEVWGAFIIPGVVLVMLFLMPWIGRTKFGHMLNIAILFVLLGGAAALTAQAIHEDYFARWNKKEEILAANDPVLAARYEASQRFLDAKNQAHAEAERVIELAKSPERIPPAGALSMAYDDPFLQGPKLFSQHCLGCHTHEVTEKSPENIAGNVMTREEFLRFAAINETDVINPSPTAPNLAGVGSHWWVLGFLNPETAADQNHLGYEGSPFAEGEMVTFVEGAFEGAEGDKRQEIEDAMRAIAHALADEADLPSLREAHQAKTVQETVAKGRELMTGGLSELLDTGTSCTDCHKFHDSGDLGLAPDLTGYMSRQWMIDFIRNPADERFYPETNDRMPAFAAHDDPKLNQLDDKSIGLIVDWLRGDWRRAAKP